MTYAFTLKFPICCHTAHLDFHVGGSYKNYFKMYSFYRCMKKQRLCWQYHQSNLYLIHLLNPDLIFMMYIFTIHIHICGFLKSLRKYWLGSKDRNIFCVLFQQLLVHEQLELLTSLTKTTSFFPLLSPLRGLWSITSFTSFSYHCMQEPSTEYLHRFLIFHFKNKTVEQW